MRPRAAPALAALAMISVLATLLAAPVAATTDTAPNGWTTHAGPGYELYLTPHQEVSASELGLVVNYGNDTMTMRVSKANQTMSSVTIAPHSSRFVQLDFATNGTYQLTLANAGSELLTLSKQRIIPVTPTPPVWHDDDWQITPPGPNPWTPEPEPQDPLTYTQAAVDALIASITLEILLITATVMGIMVAVGALVQRLVKFVFPTDLLTSLLVLANLGLVILAATGRINMGGTLWYIIPEMSGYFIGYALGSRNNDWMIQYISPRIGYTYRVPTAIYEHEGRQCIADQSNRALLKRVLFGVHHEIDSDGIRLEPNWTDSAKYRLFPKFEKRMINIESLETSNERVPIWWKFAVKRHTTRIRVAYGSQATAAELVTSVDVLDRLRNKVDQLEAERIRLEEEAPRRVVDALSGLIHPSYERTVTTRIEDFERALRPPEPESERPNPEVTTT